MSAEQAPAPQPPPVPVPKVRHSCPMWECDMCQRRILKRWCEACKKAHDSGHGPDCLARVDCDEEHAMKVSPL